jgi:REP element-mobilizing transposase RayT
MSRPRRILQNEYPYHVTTRTNGRIFKFRKNTFKLFIKVLNDVVRKFEARIQHFQLMSNHYHLKLFTPEGNLDKIMHYFNGQVAAMFNRQACERGHLWEKRYDSTIISNDEYAMRCVAYIYNNTVRAGMCRAADESDMLSSFAFYAKGQKIEFIVSEDEVFLLLGDNDEERRRNFRAMLETPLVAEAESSIRELLRSSFCGPPDFVRRMRQQYAYYLRLKSVL